MDARQAAIHLIGSSARVVDLDSRSGTLVNRRRILPGQEVVLKSGDLIELGAVQLRIVAGADAVPARSPEPRIEPAGPRPASTGGPSSFTYRLPGGAVCRNWDDFLTASAQDWKAMREELESGRIVDLLRAIGRDDLIASPAAGSTADERLDAWLGRLPSIRPGQPELDVHPGSLRVSYNSLGGRVRKTIRVANIGYRLLVCRVRVEQSGTSWLHPPAHVLGQSLTIVEGLDLPVEIELPEQAGEWRAAELVFEGNGGTVRVRVVVEPGTPARDEIPEGAAIEDASSFGWSIGRMRLMPKVSVAGRAAIGAAVFASGRLLVGLTGLMLGIGAAGPAALPGPALALGVAGALTGVLAAFRVGRSGDFASAGFAGGVAGACIAAIVVAICQAVEPLLGAGLSATVWAPILLWAGLGTGLGIAAGWLRPSPTEENS
jgi:hypothetical protein